MEDLENMENKKIKDLFFEKKLGKGSYGVVYLTSNIKEKSKKTATKVFSREIIENNIKQSNYLKNEISLLQTLDHPNIVKFDSIMKTKTKILLSMEFCNGGGLDNALEKYQEKFGQPFSEEIVQYLMRQIIDAFNYIHSQSVIHRDIKLENILINYETEKDKEEFNLMK